MLVSMGAVWNGVRPGSEAARRSPFAYLMFQAATVSSMPVVVHRLVASDWVPLHQPN